MTRLISIKPVEVRRSMFKFLVHGSLQFALWVASSGALEAGGVVGHPYCLSAKQKGEPAQHGGKASRKSGIATMGLSATQPPDTLGILPGKPPLPKGLAPALTDNLGTELSDGLSSPTEAYQNIGIKRVVSYQTKSAGSGLGGVLDPSVFASGIISEHAKLSVFVIFEYDSADFGKPITVTFNTLNMIPLAYPDGNTMSFQTTLGAESCTAITPVIIPSNWLYYGLPKFDPTQIPAIQIANNSQQYAPIPGANWLRYSVYSSQTMVSTYRINVYSFLEFDAVEPILMVHGTAADHTSWLNQSLFNSSPITISTSNGAYGPVRPFISNGSNQGYFDQSGTNYLGTWFYYIDLGINSNGNNGIIDSATSNDPNRGGLALEIPAVLDALGAKSCHLIAHSKGGSDCRYYIYSALKHNTILTPGQKFTLENYNYKYKILSLYTIGTPSQGTPCADIGHAVETFALQNLYGLLSINSSDFSVEAVGYLSGKLSISTLFSDNIPFPHGAAQRDQQTKLIDPNSPLVILNGLDAINIINSAVNGHIYSVVGDADLDRNEYINGDEAALMFLPDPANFMWSVVGRVGSVSAASSNYYSITYITLTPINSLPIIEPNDLVTPIWSAIAPGAHVIKAGSPVTSSFQFSTFNTISPSILMNYSDIFTPGNHSIIKSWELADFISKHIISDYPLKDPR